MRRWRDHVARIYTLMPQPETRSPARPTNLRASHCQNTNFHHLISRSRGMCMAHISRMHPMIRHAHCAFCSFLFLIFFHFWYWGIIESSRGSCCKTITNMAVKLQVVTKVILTGWDMYANSWRWCCREPYKRMGDRLPQLQQTPSLPHGCEGWKPGTSSVECYQCQQKLQAESAIGLRGCVAAYPKLSTNAPWAPTPRKVVSA
jgi:hypothetical protein